MPAFSFQTSCNFLYCVLVYCMANHNSLVARRATIRSVLHDILFFFSLNGVIRMQKKVTVSRVSLMKFFYWAWEPHPQHQNITWSETYHVGNHWKLHLILSIFHIRTKTKNLQFGRQKALNGCNCDQTYQIAEFHGNCNPIKTIENKQLCG